jgi:hypothetical protein
MRIYIAFLVLVVFAFTACAASQGRTQHETACVVGCATLSAVDGGACFEEPVLQLLSSGVNAGNCMERCKSLTIKVDTAKVNALKATSPCGEAIKQAAQGFTR